MINKLPVEVIQLILNHLAAADVNALSVVSKDIRRVVTGLYSGKLVVPCISLGLGRRWERVRILKARSVTRGTPGTTLGYQHLRVIEICGCRELGLSVDPRCLKDILHVKLSGCANLTSIDCFSAKNQKTLHVINCFKVQDIRACKDIEDVSVKGLDSITKFASGSVHKKLDISRTWLPLSVGFGAKTLICRGSKRILEVERRVRSSRVESVDIKGSEFFSCGSSRLPVKNDRKCLEVEASEVERENHTQRIAKHFGWGLDWCT